MCDPASIITYARRYLSLAVTLEAAVEACARLAEDPTAPVVLVGRKLMTGMPCSIPVDPSDFDDNDGYGEGLNPTGGGPERPGPTLSTATGPSGGSV